MKPSTRRFISALLGIVILVAAFIVFFDIVEPAYGNLEALKGNLIAEQQLAQTESSTVATVQGILSQYQNESSSKASVDATFPTGQDMAGAIAQISGLATLNNITVQSLGISVSAPPVVTNPQDALGASASNWLIQPTGTIAFAITGSGSYESLQSFLQDLQTNVRIFNVKQLSLQPAITAPGSRSAVSTQDLFNYTITVETYYQAP